MSKGSKTASLLSLTDQHVDALRYERERTSVGPKALLKGHDDLPRGLNHAMVTHWLAKRVQRVQPEHLEYVLALWRALPEDESIEVTTALVFELNQLRKASGADPASIVKWRSDVPDGLSLAKINRLLMGKSKTIRKRYVDYLRMVWSMGQGGS